MARKLVSSSGYTSASFQSVAVQPGYTHRRFREPMHRAGTKCAQVLRLLLIEDNCQDSFTLKASLKECGLKFLARRVQSSDEFLEALREFQPHVIISNYELSQFDAFSAMTLLNQHEREIPFIVLSHSIGEELAVQCIQRGAFDYVRKDRLERLPSLIKRATESYAEKRAKEAEERNAKQALELLRQMTENVSDFLFICSLDHKKQYYTSAAFSSVFGCDLSILKSSPEQLIERVHRQDRPLLLNALANANKGYFVQFRVRRDDGKERMLSVKARSFRVEGEDELRVCGVVRDITERQRALQLEYKENLMQQREEFIATLTHDLKNPLTGAGFILELMMSGELGNFSPAQWEILSKLRDSNQRMLNMIFNLLDVSRMEFSAQTIVKLPVNLAEVIDDCVDQIKIHAQRKEIEICLEIPDAQGLPAVRGDRASLYRVTQNLLDNAIKYSERNSAIKVSLTVEGKTLKVTVQDAGKGISAGEQEILFQRFRRTSCGQASTMSSGLGLYVCKQIVEAHNGKIVCVSEVGRGSNFEFVLPLSEEE